MSRSDDDDDGGGLIFLALVLWVLIGTCNSCRNSQKSVDALDSQHMKIEMIDGKVNSINVKIDSIIKSEKDAQKSKSIIQ